MKIRALTVSWAGRRPLRSFGCLRSAPVAPPVGSSGPRHPQEQQRPRGNRAATEARSPTRLFHGPRHRSPFSPPLLRRRGFMPEGARHTAGSIESGARESKTLYASCQLTGVSEPSPNSFSGHVDTATPGTNCAYVGRSIQHARSLFFTSIAFPQSARSSDRSI